MTPGETPIEGISPCCTGIPPHSAGIPPYSAGISPWVAYCTTNKKPGALLRRTPGFIVKVNLTNLLSFDSL